MKKPFIKKEGDFLVAATYPLEYPAYSRPVRKSLESLQTFQRKGYTPLTKGHKDKEGKFEIIGELRGLTLKEKELNNRKEGELYAKEIVLFKKGITSLEQGVYGLSPDFLYSAEALKADPEEDSYTLSDEASEFFSVALVKNPRHQVKDIDLTNLRQDLVRSMYDSSEIITKIEELPVVVVGEDSIALQDNNSCDIIKYVENNGLPSLKDIQELATSFANSLSSLIRGDSVENTTKEDLEMNKEELEKILDSKMSSLLEEKIKVEMEKATLALQDSLETSVSTAVSAGFEALKANPSAEGDATESEQISNNELSEEERANILKELELLKQERDTLKVKVSEQESLLQTMSIPSKGDSGEGSKTDPEAGVKTGSDSREFDLAATLNSIKL